MTVAKKQTISFDEYSQDPVAACSIQADRIIGLLHVAAIEKSKTPGITIENTAVEGTNVDSVKFHGPGEHIIAAKPETEGAKIEQKDAFTALQKYIELFVGPDVSKSLKEDDLQELQLDKGKTNESSIFNLSFLKFLAESGVVLFEADDEDAADLSDDDDEDEDADLSDDEDEDAADLPDDEDEDAADLPDDEDEDEDNELPDTDDDDEEDEKPDEEKSKEQEQGIANGYAVTYHLTVPNQQEQKMDSVLSNLASGFLNNFGIRFISGFGDAGTTHSLKDLGDELGTIFGEIDLDTFEPAFLANLKKKFPGAADDIHTKIYDTKVIQKYCREWIKSSDIKRLQQAEFAICVKFNKREKAPEMFKPDVIAQAFNDSIGSFIKKHTRGIGKNDMIFIKNYADEAYDRKRKKYNYDDARDIENNIPDIEDKEVSESNSSLDTAQSKLHEMNRRMQTDICTRLLVVLFEDMNMRTAQRLIEAGETKHKVWFKYPADPNNPENLTNIKARDDDGNEIEYLEVPDGGAIKSRNLPNLPNIDGWEPDTSGDIWEYQQADDPDKNVKPEDVTCDTIAIAHFQPADDETDDQRFISRLTSEKQAYISTLKSKLKDRFLTKHQFKTDFTLNDISVKRGDKMNTDIFFKILKELVKQNDKSKIQQFLDTISDSCLDGILELTYDSRELRHNSRERYGNFRDWFAYIIPMPGAVRRKTDERPETEGSRK